MGRGTDDTCIYQDTPNGRNVASGYHVALVCGASPSVTAIGPKRARSRQEERILASVPHTVILLTRRVIIKVNDLLHHPKSNGKLSRVNSNGL